MRIVVLGLLCFCAVSLPAAAQTAPRDGQPCELMDEVRSLTESVRELVGLVREQLQRTAENEGVEALVALDQGIEFLSSSLRRVLEERDEVADELATLRGRHAGHLKTLDETDDETTKANLRSFIPTAAEKIARCEERLAHLDARATELRDTIRERQRTLAMLEQAAGPK